MKLPIAHNLSVQGLSPYEVSVTQVISDGNNYVNNDNGNDNYNVVTENDRRVLAPYFNYENGSTERFFDPSSTDETGRFRVRDAREFTTKSMHRRTDSQSSGVTLLIGTRRDIDREEVITLLFDRKVFGSEHLAKEWWDKNKSRFV
mmetsp:Transcript_14880/g.14986  ORF Transcript_14880/g.14986 Transcript_14880/m.14986 type:complete len:146 (-) Transcript_14880:4-441(-)